MNKKKFLSVLMSFVLAVSLCPAAALADTEPVQDVQPGSVSGDIVIEGEGVGEDFPLSEVTVDPELSLMVGSSAKLNIIVSPEGTSYECASSDDGIVEVTKSGMVYAVAPGEADITVATGDASAVCHVTVLDAIPLESIKFAKSSVSVIQGKTYATSVVLNPADADIEGIEYSSSNTAVAAVNANGVITAKKAGTATVTATAAGKSAKCTVTVTLPNPTGVSAKANGLGAVKVSWSKVANANGYLVYRSTAKAGTYSLVKTVTSGSVLSFNNTGLTKGKAYFYKVKARNANAKCNSAFSAVVSAKATLVAPKMKVSATATKTSVKVSWTKPAGAKGYYVYRKKGTGSWLRIKTITAAGTLTYTDKKASGVCQYAVAAYGKSGTKVIVGERSAAISTRTLAAPKTIDASTGSGNDRNIYWGAVTGATGYQIYHKPGDNASWSLLATVGKTTYYKAYVNHGKYYYYKVRPIYKSNGVTTYGPFKQTAYGWLRYCDPKYSVITIDETDKSTEIMAINVTNNGKHAMTFYSEGARYTDGEGYTNYNRNLSLVNQNAVRLTSVTVGAGQSKTLFFRTKPNGNPTWYDMYGTIRVKFKYDGVYYWSYNSYYFGNSYSEIG